jgi:hypothetical protein
MPVLHQRSHSDFTQRISCILSRFFASFVILRLSDDGEIGGFDAAGEEGQELFNAIKGLLPPMGQQSLAADAIACFLTLA